MFDLKEKCGQYIKNVAIWTAIVESVAGLIVWLGAWSEGWIDVGVGFIIFLGSVAAAIITMYFLYGFGSIVEDIHVIRNKVDKLELKTQDSPKTIVNDELPEL